MIDFLKYMMDKHPIWLFIFLCCLPKVTINLKGNHKLAGVAVLVVAFSSMVGLFLLLR